LRIGRFAYRAFNALNQRLLGLRPRSVDVDGLTIPVLTRKGRGAPIVFVHGFGADKEGWFMLMHGFRGRPIIALDLPGFGLASAIGRERATAERQAHAIRGVLDQLGEERVSLVGASMGGAISLRFASEFPERTNALALLGASGPPAKPSPLALSVERGHNPLLPRTRKEFHAMLDFVAVKRPWVPDPIAEHLAYERATRHEAHTELYAGWNEQRHTIQPNLPRVAAPTLVIHGELDRCVDLSSAHAIAQHVPRSELMVLPGIGHVPQIEAPKAVALAVTRFFDRQ
jgi:pimeloyl-ACP methyl ester carboxylesterase